MKLTLAVTFALTVACSGSTELAPYTSSAGGTVVADSQPEGSGGAVAEGGSLTMETGGTSVAPTGGTSAMPTGGAVATGGRATGGSRATGGAATGGAATGGKATGGMAPTGGMATGGAATGGIATGGTLATGGAATGGSVATGGSAPTVDCSGVNQGTYANIDKFTPCPQEPCTKIDGYKYQSACVGGSKTNTDPTKCTRHDLDCLIFCVLCDSSYYPANKTVCPVAIAATIASGDSSTCKEVPRT